MNFCIHEEKIQQWSENFADLSQGVSNISNCAT